MKKQRGITLVALLITIVVLVILAGISIASIQNNNIIGRANEAATKYQEEQEKEDTVIENYDQKLESYIQESGSGTINPSTMISFTIDGVTYRVEKGTTWAEWAEDSNEWCVANAWDFNQLIIAHEEDTWLPYEEIGRWCEFNFRYIANDDTIMDGEFLDPVETSQQISNGGIYHIDYSGDMS